MIKNFAVITFLAAFFVLSSFTALDRKQYKVRTVVIDAGHGGKDPGCHGKFTKEADIALAVAMELGRIVTENLPDVKVVYTRNSNKFIELHDRAAIANKANADLFISIHCNSGPGQVHGTESFTMGLHTSEGNLDVAKRENSVILQESNYEQHYDGFDPNSPQAHILFALYQHAFIESSLKFAKLVEDEFHVKTGRPSRGVKQAGLLVLWKTTMPGALIEIGFLTNSQEEKYLRTKTNQVFVASAIYRALKEYKADIESMN